MQCSGYKYSNHTILYVTNIALRGRDFTWTTQFLASHTTKECPSFCHTRIVLCTCSNFELSFTTLRAHNKFARYMAFDSGKLIFNYSNLFSKKCVRIYPCIPYPQGDGNGDTSAEWNKAERSFAGCKTSYDMKVTTSYSSTFSSLVRRRRRSIYLGPSHLPHTTVLECSGMLCIEVKDETVGSI